MYSPSVSVSTVPVVTTVTSPERSVAAAPASVYVDPNSAVAGLSPVTVTTGAVVSSTLTVLVAEVVLPFKSVAEYVTVYDPTTEVSTLLEVETETLVPRDDTEVAPASE